MFENLLISSYPACMIILLLGVAFAQPGTEAAKFYQFRAKQDKVICSFVSLIPVLNLLAVVWLVFAHFLGEE